MAVTMVSMNQVLLVFLVTQPARLAEGVRETAVSLAQKSDILCSLLHV